MTPAPLHHIVRMRTSDDLTYMREGLMDEVVLNANHVENSLQACAAKLWKTSLPFSIDPVLWRFQVPSWSENGKGDTKRNYKRLAAEYTRGTSVTLGNTPLLETAITDDQWRTIATNIVAYQRDRLAIPTQLDLLESLRELHPSRITAPALIAFDRSADRINHLLAVAAAEAANQSVAVQVILPLERLLDKEETQQALTALPREGVSSYLLWTPKVTEERLITDSELLMSLMRVVADLANDRVPVGHQYANYTIFSLHSVGLAAATHHLGWVDNGEPAEERRGAIRSCRLYVPGVRHCLRFPEARQLAENLSAEEYLQHFCDCTLCAGFLSEGGHPFEWLLEAQKITYGKSERMTPTAQAVGANTWHYLLSRRQEVNDFSNASAADVIARDIERAAALNRSSADVLRLEGLASHLRTA
jgi:hypothetical protein